MFIRHIYKLAYIAMTEEEILEKILLRLNEEDASGLYVSSFINRTFGLELSSGVKYADRLEALGLAREGETRTRMFITDHGRQIVKNGGLLKYLTDLEIQKDKSEQIAELEAVLLQSNIDTNKLNNKVSKANVWFAIINVLALLINLYIALKSAK
jgi:hypothetical protein